MFMVYSFSVSFECKYQNFNLYDTTISESETDEHKKKIGLSKIEKSLHFSKRFI